jgi:exonuclease III
MRSNQISVLALQETFERANDPPVGLPKAVFSKPSDNGRRGVMMIINPALQHSARLASKLGGINPNILWISLNLEGPAYFVASVYLPDNSKNREADEVVRQLFADIEAVPCDAHIIIMGDWNYDPFSVKGKNKHAFKTMMAHPRMALLHRNSPLDHTRPAANTHVDNIFISKSLAPKTFSQILYLHIPPHGRIPSDHLIIGFKSSWSGKRNRLRPVALQYDCIPLRTGLTLHTAKFWMDSRRDCYSGRQR